ncbi:MAG: glycosyltransferase [Lachnospiraceae bacterium]|nr:glycosyltransferase [Lachnospiraceae bacterium]
MRILFVLNTVALYGATRSAIDLACGLKRLGQEIYFFIPKESRMDERHALKNEMDKYGFQYIFLDYYPSIHRKSEKGFSEKMFRKEINERCLDKMKGYVKKWEINIIHTNSLTHLIGADLSRQVNKPHVWHIREAIKEHYDFCYDWMIPYKYELLKSEQIVCISDFVKRTYRTMLFGSNVITLKDGFYVERYLIEGGYQKTKKNYTLIICGAIQEAKGQLDAVKAVGYLIHKYHLKNIHLQIVGDGSGIYRQEIMNYIEAKSLNKYIDILPFQSDLYELRKHADIALMCSRGEALGRVTVEAMLSENLVIGADSAGTKEIIKDGVVGYLYKAGNVMDLSEKIYNAIIHWDEQEKIIKKASQYAKREFGIENYANKMLEIYKRIAGQKQECINLKNK